MSTLKLCMLAVLGIAVATVLKQWKSDLLPLFRLSLVIAFAMIGIGAAQPFFVYLKNLTGNEGLTEYATILIKALGIAILTQCCAEICRECGEGGTASGIELVGKIEILLLCLPLIDEILTVAKQLLYWGT